MSLPAGLRRLTLHSRPCMQDGWAAVLPPTCAIDFEHVGGEGKCACGIVQVHIAERPFRVISVAESTAGTEHAACSVSTSSSMLV
jgi:hypothetical protein